MLLLYSKMRIERLRGKTLVRLGAWQCYKSMEKRNAGKTVTQRSVEQASRCLGMHERINKCYIGFNNLD